MNNQAIIKALKSGVIIHGDDRCGYSIENITDGKEMALMIIGFLNGDDPVQLEDWLNEKIDVLAGDILSTYE